MFSAYKNKKVLVTGGAGFIGSHLCYALVKHGASVTILDNLSTGSLEKIDHIYKKVLFIKEDIRNYQACLAATANQQIIFHCAAYTSVIDSTINPQECFEHNVLGTLHILSAAQKNRVEKVIFSSSASVYGNYEGICHEELEPQPISPYAVSKRVGELMCKYFFDAHGIDTLILRYFNVIGAGASLKTFPAYVLKQIKENLPIIIYGDGKQTRDFVPVETVVKANLIGALVHSNSGQIINVASGTSVSLNQFIQDIQARYAPYTASVLYQEPKSGDIKHSAADISRLQALYKLYES